MSRYLTRKLPEPTLGLKQKICSSLAPEQFYRHFLSDFSFNRNYICPFPAHKDTDPSFRVQPDGQYVCYGCNRKGSNIIQFWCHLKELDFHTAQRQVYAKFVARIVEAKRITSFVKSLHEDAEMLNYLQTTRGWSLEVIQFARLGFCLSGSTKYITIPIHDEYGFVTTIKYYNVLHKEGQPKFYFEAEGDNTPKIYGLPSLSQSKEVYLFEGEPDCLLALSLGYPAATLGSAATWKDSWRNYFHAKDVIICYDRDKAGEKGARHLSHQLVPVANSIKVIRLPRTQDFTELLYSSQFNRTVFDSLVQDTSYLKTVSIDPEKKYSPDEGDVIDTTLAEAPKAEHHQRMLRLLALVGGKEPSPLVIPRRVRYLCQDKPSDTKCGFCALGKTPKLSQEFDIEPHHPKLLELLTTRARDLERTLRRTHGVNSRCQVETNVELNYNVEKVVLNNPVIPGQHLANPERRLGFYLGLGLQINRNYSLVLFTAPHPIDNSVCHVITSADPIDTDLDDFKILPENHIALQSFRPTPERPLAKVLEELQDIQEKNLTRIWGRPQLHLAVDLPFFAPNEFVFAEEHVRRGGLDVLIFGDQRCGKGRVAEGLAQYYRFGEVLSGENISFMNLVGGIESGDNYRGLRWGRIVANHRGVIILDEASALELEVFARLSRIRSEGIAELDKFGIHAKAPASCSILWLANPRGKSLADFNFAVEAIPGLVGQPEDIARFDYAFAVRNEEVDPEVINMYHRRRKDPFGDKLHRLLVLWCKTRTRDEVIFQDDAAGRIFAEALKLGRDFHPRIPLVQSANIRIKLAKISAAIAGRVYSSDPDGKQLWVKEKHVEAATQFLRDTYSGVLGYYEYSNLQKQAISFSASQLEENVLVKQMIQTDGWTLFCAGILRLPTLTVNDLHDHSHLGPYESKELMAHLVKVNAVYRTKSHYQKTPAFIKYLKKQFE